MPLLLTAAMLATAMCGVRAQGSGVSPDATSSEVSPEASISKRIDKAIAAYEAVRKDNAKLVQRRRMLGWLGEIDHPRVTEYLKKNLVRTVKRASGRYSVEAIEKLPRPDLEPSLMAVVKRGDANHLVRVAATLAVTKFGNSSCNDLLDLAAETKSAAVRRGVLEGLCKCTSSKVLRGVAQLILDGDHAHRLSMLMDTRFAMDNVKIDNARIKCIKEGNLAVAARAWRQLAEHGHRRSKALALDVLERVYTAPSAAIAADLVTGLVLVGDEDFFPAVLRFGATRGAVVKKALRAVTGVAAKDPVLIEFLIEEGIESGVPGERNAAKILLSKAPASAVAPLVARVRKQLKRNRTKVLDSAAGLHELLAKDPTWVNDLVGLTAAPDLESRLLGLAMLHEMESPGAITYAQRYLKHRAWELRSLSFRYLTKCRDVTSIPMLIDRYGKEEGRLEYELNNALFAHTGTRCWTRPGWANWWRGNSEGFALPHADSIKGGGNTTGGKTVSYYDLPLVSSRIAFLVDHSGSMNARVGTDRKRNRLDAAKEQLRIVVSDLPKTHKVNLILFESGVTSVWRELRSLNGSNRRELLEKVEKIKLAGGTNTYGALMLALEDPEVDTIYLLTDGQPSAGEVIDSDEIVDAVHRENRVRQVVVHCISIGLDSQLLKDLADLTGGQYRFVR